MQNISAMWRTKLIIIIMLSSIGFIGCTGSSNSETPVRQRTQTQHSSGTPPAKTPAEIRSDSLARIDEQEQRTRDSVIRNVSVGDIIIKPDNSYTLSERLDYDHVLPLHEIYTYFTQGDILSVQRYTQGDILSVQHYQFRLWQVKGKFLAAIGYRGNSTDAWASSLNEALKLFEPALTSTDKKLIRGSLEEHSMLMGNLAKLSDADMNKLISIMDTIVSKQNDNGSWVTSGEGDSLLMIQHTLLSKVWKMPKLVKGEGYYGETNCHYLGQYTKEYYGGRIWNTRYLNRFQFAAGFFHRRCIDAVAHTAAERKTVGKKIAELMKDAASKLTDDV